MGNRVVSRFKKVLYKLTSEMKRKAPGAQEPEHMGYM
jgi:hypothetical protein